MKVGQGHHQGTASLYRICDLLVISQGMCGDDILVLDVLGSHGGSIATLYCSFLLVLNIPPRNGSLGSKPLPKVLQVQRTGERVRGNQDQGACSPGLRPSRRDVVAVLSAIHSWVPVKTSAFRKRS